LDPSPFESEDDPEPENIDHPVFVGGKGVGDWQIVLSSRAYRNLRSLTIDSQSIEILRSRITDLAAGNAKAEVLASRSGAPRVPLKVTKWHPEIYFLWQVDIAVGPKPDMEQQVIKVWAVEEKEKIHSTFDEVKRFQQSFTDVRVTRCLEEGPFVRGKRWPKAYEHSADTKDMQRQAALDVRIVDPEFVDAFNKSFTLTENLLQSIIKRDLTAEFPFDLSSSELRILQHFKTPTLIMGRSGTGKTTCLIFKMILRYIATHEVTPERMARQVDFTILLRPKTGSLHIITYAKFP